MRLELDPNGDIEIILTNPNEQKWEWVSPNVFVPVQQQSASLPSKTKQPHGAELRVLASSRDLKLASCVFRNMLNGPWAEGSENKKGGVTTSIGASEWDAEAFCIVLDIIHGHYTMVPEKVSLELLVKIAVIADYYCCYEVVRVFANTWVKALEPQTPDKYGKELVLWMTVAWVFLQQDLLVELVRNAIKTIKGPFKTMGLPLPERLVHIIDNMRLQGLRNIAELLGDLQALVLENEYCDPSCLYPDLLLGALTRLSYSVNLASSQVTTSPLTLEQITSRIDGLANSNDEVRLWNHRLRKSVDPPGTCDHHGLGLKIAGKLEQRLKSLKYLDLMEVLDQRLKQVETAKSDGFAKRRRWRESIQ